MHLLFGCFLLPFGVLHFLPTIIAAFRNSRHTVGIFLINLFLSWTVIGWVIALIWACTSESRNWYGYPQRYRRF
jgi:predicted small integral membrane protein